MRVPQTSPASSPHARSNTHPSSSSTSSSSFSYPKSVRGPLHGIVSASQVRSSPSVHLPLPQGSYGGRSLLSADGTICTGSPISSHPRLCAGKGTWNGWRDCRQSARILSISQSRIRLGLVCFLAHSLHPPRSFAPPPLRRRIMSREATETLSQGQMIVTSICT